MNRRRKVILLSILGIAAILGLWAGISRAGAPRFVPVPPGFKIPESHVELHEKGCSMNCEDGLMWIGIGANWRWHLYLYDIEHKKILGELIEAMPKAANREQTKILLDLYSPSAKERCFCWLEQISGGKFHSNIQTNERCVMVLDRTRHEITEVGRFQPYDGAYSWSRSPDGRYCFAQRYGEAMTAFCDLETCQMKNIPIRYNLHSWWDNSHILCRSDHDYLLYDIFRHSASKLLDIKEQRKFVEEHHLEIDLSKKYLSIEPMRVGTNYEFYLVGPGTNWSSQALAKFDRSGRLVPVVNFFNLEPNGSFDSSGRYWTYCGLDRDQSAVFVRDIQTGATRTLVEPSGERECSMPEWYRDSIIFW